MFPVPSDDGGSGREGTEGTTHWISVVGYAYAFFSSVVVVELAAYLSQLGQARQQGRFNQLV